MCCSYPPSYYCLYLTLPLNLTLPLDLRSDQVPASRGQPASGSYKAVMKGAPEVVKDLLSEHRDVWCGICEIS